MSTELENRLRSLGEHIDAERAVFVDDTLTTVVPFAPRRSPRVWWAAAAAVALVVGLVAVFAGRDDATQPTDTVPPTADTTGTVPSTSGPTIDTTPTTVGQVEPPESQPGDLTFEVTYGSDDREGVAQRVTNRIRERLQLLGLEGAVTDDDPSDPLLRVLVRGVRSEDQVAVLRAIIHLGDDVVFRPVTGECGARPDAPSTLPASDPTAEQLLPLQSDTPGQWCTVGPAELNREVFDTATYSASADPSVPGMLVADLQPGGGTEAWNALAADCYDHTTSCPTGQMAIEWGGVLMNAPTVQTPEFEGSVALGVFGDIDGLALADQLNVGPANFRITAVEP